MSRHQIYVLGNTNTLRIEPIPLLITGIEITKRTLLGMQRASTLNSGNEFQLSPAPDVNRTRERGSCFYGIFLLRVSAVAYEKRCENDRKTSGVGPKRAQ